MLKFSPHNAKTKALYDVPALAEYLQDKRKVYSLDLSAGHSCPGAKQCLSRAVPRDDDPTRFRILDGPHCDYRCFSASQEVQYPSTRAMRWHNYQCLRQMRGKNQCYRLLADSLPDNCGVLRYHVAGDFFKLSYLHGALLLAQARPDVLFYGYTKSLRFLLNLPMYNPHYGIFHNPNFLLTASWGGKWDHLIGDLGIRSARVVKSVEKAGMLPIDHDDSHAATIGGHFALLIHGTQPAGSDSAKALQALKGQGSYARK